MTHSMILIKNAPENFFEELETLQNELIDIDCNRLVPALLHTPDAFLRHAHRFVKEAFDMLEENDNN